MEEKDIDRRFKVEKEDEYLDPPAFVWESLEQDLKKNNRKRFFIWWFAGLIIVLGLSSYLYQKINLTQEEYSELVTTAQKETDFKSDKSVDLKNNDIQNEIALQSEHNSQARNNTDDENVNNVENQSKKSTLLIENTGAVKKINNSYSKITKQNQGNEYYDVNSKPSMFNNSKLRTLSIADDFETKVIHQNANSEESLNERIENDFLIRKKLVIPILKNNLLNLFPFSRNLKKPTPCYLQPINIHKKRLNTIEVTMHLGRPIFSNVLINKESTITEADWYSYGLGISYYREIINRLYLDSGVNFRQSKRKFNYKSEEISIQGYEQKLSTPTIPLEYGRLISEGEQHFSFLDLSLGLKYDVWSKRIKVSVGLAAILNLQLRSDGKTLDNDLRLIRYTNDDNLYQSNLGFGFSPSIIVDIPIYKNFNFTLSPNYTSYFQNLENEQPLREMKYSNFGLDLGVSQKF